MDKPFLTIEEQVERLKLRGLAVDDNTRIILMRESYYSIVNGYKDPFIDRVESGRANDDRYRKGCSFDDLYNLFLFDRKLRHLTFEYLIQAEAVFKTAVVYIFSKHHKDEQHAFLSQENFCDEKEFHNPKRYRFELSKLVGLLSEKVERSELPYVKYYRNNHNCIPLWVLVNEMTFGNIIHFFELMKPAEREGASRMIAEAVGRWGDKRTGYFGGDKMFKTAEVLRRFRNVCAHDERLYSKKVGISPVSYFQMIWMLEHYLTKSEFEEFVQRLSSLINEFSRKNKAFISVIRNEGFSDFELEFKKCSGK